jgi:hypothetical protein
MLHSHVVLFATSCCNVGLINVSKLVTAANVCLVVRSLDISVIVGGTAVFLPVEKESCNIVRMDEASGMEDSYVMRLVTGEIPSSCRLGPADAYHRDFDCGKHACKEVRMV